MEFGSCDGRKDGRYSDVDFVEIYKIFMTQDAIFLEQYYLIEYTVNYKCAPLVLFTAAFLNTVAKMLHTYVSKSPI